MGHPHRDAFLGMIGGEARKHPAALLEQNPGASPIGGADRPASSTVSAKRRPAAIGVTTNLPSASAVGMRGMISGSGIIR